MLRPMGGDWERTILGPGVRAMLSPRVGRSTWGPRSIATGKFMGKIFEGA